MLRRIDKYNRKDHSLLSPDDNCFYLFEYTSGAGWSTAANQIVLNLKKKPSESHKAGYHYKEDAIAECIEAFRREIPARWWGQVTLVPVPGSKAVGDPNYDDRMERICRGLDINADVRTLVRQSRTTIASHEVKSGGDRLSIGQLEEIYEIDGSLLEPAPSKIAIVDDVLAAGAHFRAMSNVLSAVFPNVKIGGLFVARRVFSRRE